MSKKKPQHFTRIDLDEKPMTQKEIIDEIAGTLGLHKDLIKVVLSNYYDIALREIIANGTFRIPGLCVFKSAPHNQKGNQKYHDSKLGVTISPPPTVKLTVSASQNLKKIYRQARRWEETKRFGLDPEDWWKPFVVDEDKK